MTCVTCSPHIEFINWKTTYDVLLMLLLHINCLCLLLQHEFIREAKSCTVLARMIQEAREILEAQALQPQQEEDSVSSHF